MSDQRSSPEHLLGAINRETDRLSKGRLRIFLGMCPGVGKTYEMLQAAHIAQARGTRVLVGIVETHGRKDTEALLNGLPVLAPREVEYKGTILKEMDLDGILQAKPKLVLVDELAHTNAPGSRHSKRYQDVEELLAAGVDVFTTVNIQHIESRNDQVAQITGVVVRETVPDSILERAAQVEIIDLPPSELLQRLKEGKVYLGDRAGRAIENFFKEEHLTALRELALRLVADRVDQDLQSEMTTKGIPGPWNTQERILVAVSHSPYSTRLIRSTRRMAYRLEAPWIALYVESGESLSQQDELKLQENLALARKLGAEVVTVADHDIAHAIQKICSERNVTQIVIGRPDRRFFRDLFSQGSLLDQLVRTTSKIDIHVIRADRKPRFRGFSLGLPPRLSADWLAYYNTAWFLLAVSFFGYGLMQVVGYRAIGPVFQLAILVVSAFASRGPIFFSAVVLALVWDVVFIPPQWTIVISAPEDITMLISFFVTATIGGLLTARIRQREAALEVREKRARLLYELSQNLAEATSVKQIQTVLASTVDRQFGGQCTVFFTDINGKPDWTTGFGKRLEENELAVAQWAFENNKPAGWSTQTLAGAGSLCLPMRGRRDVVGILAFRPTSSQRDFSIEKENFLDTVLSQAAIAFERFQFSVAAENAKVYIASEKLHQTVLNTVSHELRTPITAIIGSATALKELLRAKRQAFGDALTDDLIESATRLDRLVGNLLDLSRLQKGSLQLKLEWFCLTDLFDVVRESLKTELKNRDFILSPSDSILVEGDFNLLSQALNQIVLNALKYSPDGSAIEVHVSRTRDSASIVVTDLGAGIPPGL